MNGDAPAQRGLLQRYRDLSLGTKILVFMVAGIIVGLVLGQRAVVLQPLGDLFIRLLMMAAVPLVFFNLLAGLTSLTDMRLLGRLGGKILAYFLITEVVALTLGLAMMYLLQPGRGMELTGEVDQSIGQVPRLTDVLLDLVPQNVFAAFAEGRVAQIVVFALFLGIATLMLPEDPRQKLQQGFQSAAAVMRKLVELVLRVGPIGIGALAATTVGQYGTAIFGPLARFIGGVWAAQAAMVVLYLLLLLALTPKGPIWFLRQTGPVYATTAATCSSLASLVVSFEVAEKKLRIPEQIYSFTLPLGAQLNKDGTSIMLASVLLFTAQAAGVEFDMASHLTIVIVALILSEGSSGIPAGGLVVAMILVQAFNLPLEIAAIVAGIYRLIDMGNTTVNIMGDLVGTTIVAHSEAAPSGPMAG